MRPASYKIHSSEHHDLVSSSLVGFFSLQDVEDYSAEAERAILACFYRHGRYRILIDVSECAIQSQDVVAAFLEHVQRMPISQKSAVIVGSSIVRMQIRRVMNRPNAALFENRRDAGDWITEITI